MEMKKLATHTLYLISYFILLLFGTSPPAITTVTAYRAKDLYSSTDDVLLLNSSSFNPSLFHENKDITFMVQFYNSFCGHCQQFAPIYKELATRLKGWRNVILIAGIDCSKEENLQTCSENKIAAYPSVLLYPPNARLLDPADSPEMLKNMKTIDDIEEGIINYLGSLVGSGRKYPPVLEAFEPVRVSDIKSIKSIYPDATEHDESTGETSNSRDLMFIVEDEASYIGRRLIIQYYRIHHKLELRRIALNNEKLLVQILTNEELKKLASDQPLLVRIDLSKVNAGVKKGEILVRGESGQNLSSNTESGRLDFIYHRFKMFLDSFYSIELGNIHDQLPRPKQGNTKDEESRDEEELEIYYLLHNDPVGSKRIIAIDLLKSIVYMLTHEVRVKGDLSVDEYVTLKNLLTILKKYIPLEKWDKDVNAFIEELRSRVDNNRAVYERRGMTSNEVSNLLEISGADRISSKYKNRSWISCSASDRDNKGYTCSLWLLFHTLTVGEFSKAAPVRSKPGLVLHTMRGYITKFLGCTVCAANFKKETESLENSLNSRNSSILWLWNTHNYINQRLNNEKQNDKKPLAEVIFPSHRRCPHCYLTDPKEIGVDGKTLVDIQWNSSNVLSYLIGLFRPDRIVSPVELNVLLNKIKGRVNYDLLKVHMNDDKMMDTMGYTSNQAEMNRSVEQWNIFSTSDISLCLFLYLLCVVMVSIVCIAINPKWKRYKAKQ